MGEFDSELDSSDNALAIMEIQNTAKSNTKKLKVLEGVLKDLDADVVMMNNEIEGPQNDGFPLLVQDCLLNVSDKANELPERMD